MGTFPSQALLTGIPTGLAYCSTMMPATLAKPPLISEQQPTEEAEWVLFSRRRFTAFSCLEGCSTASCLLGRNGSRPFLLLSSGLQSRSVCQRTSTLRGKLPILTRGDACRTSTLGLRHWWLRCHISEERNSVRYIPNTRHTLGNPRSLKCIYWFLGTYHICFICISVPGCHSSTCCGLNLPPVTREAHTMLLTA